MSLCSCFWFKKKAKKLKNDEEDDVKHVEGRDRSPENNVQAISSSSGSSEVVPNIDKNGAQLFTFSELVSATNNFETIIGKGGFGAVYKGRLERTNQVIAVKRLNRQGSQGEKEFKVEALILSVLSHPNLVTLIGYCSEDDQRLLVYEYMPLGSLEDHLYDSKSNKETLDWNTRVKIAVGAAKGMEYLHHQADPPVIYRDLKPANVLLGDGFHPKLSDFGLARFGPTGDKAHISTRVVGTYGYCAPEYALTGKLTIKSDIFSFGIVLLELITGRQALDDTQTGHMQWLINWIQPLIEDNDIRKIADPRLRGEFPEGSMYKALNLARLCIQRDVTLRPSMSDVVRSLEEIAFDNNQYDKSVELEQSSCKVADDQESDVPTETTKMLMTLDNKDLERANAVAEAKIWAENCRRNLGHI